MIRFTWRAHPVALPFTRGNPRLFSSTSRYSKPPKPPTDPDDAQDTPDDSISKDSSPPESNTGQDAAKEGDQEAWPLLKRREKQKPRGFGSNYVETLRRQLVAEMEAEMNPLQNSEAETRKQSFQADFWQEASFELAFARRQVDTSAPENTKTRRKPPMKRGKPCHPARMPPDPKAPSTLIVSGIGPNVKPTDFYRLLPNDLNNWSSIITKVQQEYVTETLEPRGRYVVTFESFEAADSYRDKVRVAFGLAKTKAQSRGGLWQKDIPSTTSLEEAKRLADGFTLAPAMQNYIKVEAKSIAKGTQPWATRLDKMVGPLGYGDQPHVVLLDVQPPTLTEHDLAELIHADWLERGVRWQVSRPRSLDNDIQSSGSNGTRSAASKTDEGKDESSEERKTGVIKIVEGKVDGSEESKAIEIKAVEFKAESSEENEADAIKAVESKADGSEGNEADGTNVVEAKAESSEESKATENKAVQDKADEVNPINKNQANGKGTAYNDAKSSKHAAMDLNRWEKCKSRFIVVCAAESEARRFQRHWNQRTLLGAGFRDGEQNVVRASLINW